MSGSYKYGKSGLTGPAISGPYWLHVGEGTQDSIVRLCNIVHDAAYLAGQESIEKAVETYLNMRLKMTEEHLAVEELAGNACKASVERGVQAELNAALAAVKAAVKRAKEG